MGNSAGVLQYQKLSNRDVEQFNDIDRRVRRGYYRDHSDDYNQDLRSAIKNSRIDILEILLACNDKDPNKIQPLHIAATYGNMESVELLISAGYSVTATDSHG